ncbi:MAG: response regulator, partial [bacterium]|nr:response regulator [bacterium]
MSNSKFPEVPILLVDDEEHILKSFSINLKYSGINNIITLNDSRAVMPLLESQPVEVIVLDLIMPHIPGEELLRLLQENYPHIPVIIITATNDVDTAVTCMKYGAADYMLKPVERNRMVSGVKRMLQLQALKRE